jgi:hypothetical protein
VIELGHRYGRYDVKCDGPMFFEVALQLAGQPVKSRAGIWKAKYIFFSYKMAKEEVCLRLMDFSKKRRSMARI